MRLLLDTNVLIALIDERLHALDVPMVEAISAPEAVVHASVASLCEIAIKARLGKLALAVSLTLLPDLIQSIGLELIAIDHRHVLADVQPDPPTRDPFDKLLLAQCQVESLRLMTLDRALLMHPLVWRASSAV